MKDFGVGPVSLDVAMAEAHGWSPEAIAKVEQELASISRREGAVARLNRPDLYAKDVHGNIVYVGPLPKALQPFDPLGRLP